MKRLLLILALATMAAPALAQDSTCPLKINDVRSLGTKIHVLFQNISRAEITRYEFVVSLLDSAGEEHYLPVILARKHVKASQTGTAVIPAQEAPQLSVSQARAYILRVSFADGGAWSDDGSHSCGLTALQE